MSLAGRTATLPDEQTLYEAAQQASASHLHLVIDEWGPGVAYADLAAGHDEDRRRRQGTEEGGMTPVPLNDLQLQMLRAIAQAHGTPTTGPALGELVAELLNKTLIDQHTLALQMARARRAAEQSRGG